jgi:rhomboid protease GluP
MSDAGTSTETNSTNLPAPSRQKAMDWSLVLASQAIPHLIASPDESGQWSLRIASSDVSRASKSIRQYEAENRTRPWQQPYLEGRLVFDWVALVWVAALILIHILSEAHPALKKSGVMHGLDVAHGEWWRLVTATQLHADWGHLASNLSIGFMLLGLVMGRWGTATGMLAALLAGIGGNVGNWLLQPAQTSLGASGVVMGCIGLLAVQPHRAGQLTIRVWTGLLGGVGGATMLFMLLGLDPHADVLGHAGGFVTGLLLALLLRAFPALIRDRRLNGIATFVLAGLVLLAWKLEFSDGNPIATVTN